MKLLEPFGFSILNALIGDEREECKKNTTFFLMMSDTRKHRTQSLHVQRLMAIGITDPHCDAFNPTTGGRPFNIYSSSRIIVLVIHVKKLLI